MPRSTGEGRDPVIERRVGALLNVAREFGTGVPLPELVRLLPSEAGMDESVLRGLFEQAPFLGRIEGELALPACGNVTGLADRRARGRQLQSVADAWIPTGLGASLRWTRCLGLTGSVAFGEPQAGDDLDFFVVARPGSVWIFLVLTYLSIRLRSRPRLDGEPVIACFNFVIDDVRARTEFARPRGFQFAREALSMRILKGESYYQDLLRASPWMSKEIPRLYAERISSGTRPSESPTPLFARVVNACLFPVLAGYLQLAGLYRNARSRRSGSVSESFRSETTLRRLVFTSRKWQRLADHYRDASVGEGSVPEEGLTPTGRAAGG
ncbi:MAG: hypothetical protein WCA77_04245 [Thermoplasmata archaeon]